MKISEIPNLDDHSIDPNDYDKLIVEFLVAGQCLLRLSNYAQIKAESIKERKAGNIEKAFLLSRNMENTYNELPDWARW
jgi:hypothetical protein